jgi:RNA polymerase sigma-70 factor (ECF subfamily)
MSQSLQTDEARDRPLAELADEALVDMALAGSQEAGELLFRRHQGWAYRVAKRMLGSPSDAEDAVQESFLAAWRGLDAFRGQASFSSWLYRIVMNRCLNQLRSKRPVAPLNEELPAASHDQPDRLTALAEQRLALSDVIDELPEDQRVCWILREGEGLSYSEIARITDFSEDAVRGKLYRARTTVASRMMSWR